MANSAWRDRSPTPDAPLAVGIHFGARPGWEPGREGAVTDLAVRSPDTGEVRTVHRGVCYLCHDGLSSARMPELVVCGACGRYSAERSVEAILAEFPPPRPSTPAELAEWEELAEHEKYPDRRPAPPLPPKPKRSAGEYLYQSKAG